MGILSCHYTDTCRIKLHSNCRWYKCVALKTGTLPKGKHLGHKYFCDCHQMRPTPTRLHARSCRNPAVIYQECLENPGKIHWENILDGSPNLANHQKRAPGADSTVHDSKFALKLFQPNWLKLIQLPVMKLTGLKYLILFMKKLPS